MKERKKSKREKEDHAGKKEVEGRTRTKEKTKETRKGQEEAKDKKERKKERKGGKTNPQTSQAPKPPPHQSSPHALQKIQKM